MRHIQFSALSVLLLIGCGSSATRPASVPRPEVGVRQLGPVFFGSGTTAPISFEIGVSNPGAEPLVVQRIRLESPGMTQFAIYSREGVFNQTIPPGSAKTFTISTTAIAAQRAPQITEPLTIRAIADFQYGATRFREIYQIQSVGE